MEKMKKLFAGRPHWMNALMIFCAYMTFIYMPFDLFYKPVDQDAEVWFGYMLHGWAAKATEPLHWLIYGAGFFGFLKMNNGCFPGPPFMSRRSLSAWLSGLGFTAKPRGGWARW